MSLTLTRAERRWLVALIVVVVAVRVATLGAYTLMDSTEARYAEIARKMAETGDWITPQIDYGVPFWGKPPLSTWLAAGSIALLGANEFAARFPSLLLLLGAGALVWQLARLRGGRDHAIWATVFFSTSVLAFVSDGSVMTDPALALGTTLSMAGFWLATEGPEQVRRAGGVAFFAGLAVGLLAKGPVAVVLTFLPVAGWVLWTRRWRAAVQRLPWIRGMLFVALAVVPWYAIAEVRTPGFLEYFLVGEHWRRFVDSGWKGDLYGSAHAHTRGMIWLYAVAAMLPWSLPAIGWLGRAIATRSLHASRLAADPWRAYLVIWAVAPMLFFTLSGNILWTYVLPGIPAFALLVAEFWRPDADRRDVTDRRRIRHGVRRVLIIGALVPAIFAAGTILLHEVLETERSQEELVEEYELRRDSADAHLVYFPERPPSAEFYTRGKAVLVTDVGAMRPYFDDATADFFAVRERDLGMLPEAIRSRLESLGSYEGYRLLRESRR